MQRQALTRVFTPIKSFGAWLWRFCKRRPFVSGFVLLLALIFLPGFFKSKPVPVYEYTTVDHGVLERTITSSGRLQPRELVMVGAEVSGLVLAVDVDVGDKVRAGQRLAQIEDAVLASEGKAAQSRLESAQASLASAEASARNAHVDFERFKSLRAQGYVTQKDFEAARLRVDQAEAARATEATELVSARATAQRARINFGRASIVTPINGTVIERYINKGQSLASNFQVPTLFQVASDLSEMNLEVYVDEVDMAHVKIGDKARFTVDTFAGENFSGIVEKISNAPVDINGATAYKVTAKVRNPNSKLRPGMNATVTIITHSYTDVLRVPIKAVNFGQSFDPEKVAKKSKFLGIEVRVERPGQRRGRWGGRRGGPSEPPRKATGEGSEKITLWVERTPKAPPEAVEVEQWFKGDDYVAINGGLVAGARLAVGQK